MKKRLPLLLFPALFVSCAPWQYMTVNSTGLSQNQKHEFVTENDSLRFVYNFNGQNAPLKILIQNKMDKPVYIDWNQSALVVNGLSIGYTTGPAQIQGTIDGVSTGYRGSTSFSADLHASAALPEHMIFVPSQAYVSRTCMYVSNQYFTGLPESAYHKQVIKSYNGFRETINQADFSESNSPLIFTSYIAVKVGDPTASAIIYQHAFYVSAIVKTNAAPILDTSSASLRGDHYFVQAKPGDY